MNDNYLEIGIITRFQGNKGEVRIKATTDIPERFLDLDFVYLKRGKELKELEIEYIRFHKQFVIIKFFAVNSIDEAEKLKNYQVLIDKSEKYLLPEDNFYVSDLIDCEVYLESGRYLGTLIDVVDTSGTDIFLVQGQDKKYMLPASREMILEIDLENKKIIVDPIPGILDL
ncbi:16S rRNA processing protein RimM [Halanaerobium congolense]|uniref:Ribosome maturation factor RimM n=1 Tax=Halanaerobium congolense TaxID=54121 RepID=A0A1G6I3U6_9FIRM|nr:ribosome maturation factor RimM [Halanaerobium congolense]KXS48623.1 MAG: Ribosome maturation factor RimM [Halanaerobium sp. T82-1]OEG63300.1 MAG: 16S rRNA processing protein RimM [Halanaerobium sp. MDAL1]PTX17072.1 16S rRNA processing protein RimM [Halanaerobium congolense]PXV66019.1 16S rRNA processing protein RimM [Halanaerobium congolense]TDP27132.1 16S rRNA processing protein RimM [Halanaerobium congolense]